MLAVVAVVAVGGQDGGLAAHVLAVWAPVLVVLEKDSFQRRELNSLAGSLKGQLAFEAKSWQGQDS